ncbi:MAG: caspase family protein [Nitrospirae bacterium]|nr:caspase family protein [Nitrospirota bacterium]
MGFSDERRFIFLTTCLIIIFSLATLSACGTTRSAEKSPSVPVMPAYGKTDSAVDVPVINPAFSKSMDSGIINSLSMSQDGQYLAVGLRDSVWLWDTINVGRDKKILQSSGIRDVTAIRFSDDGRFLVVGGYRTIEVWDVPAGRLSKRIEVQGDYITALTFSPDGRFLAGGSRGASHAIWFWEVSSGRLAKTLRWDWKYSDEVKALTFTKDSLRLASVAIDGIIRIWDVRSGTVEKNINTERVDIPATLDFSPDGSLIAAGTAQGQLIWWKISDGTLVRRINAHNSPITSVAFNEDGKSVISAGLDRVIRIWDSRTGNLREAKRTGQDIERFTLTENGQRMVAIEQKGISSYQILEAGGVPPMIAILYPGDKQAINKPGLSVSAKVVDDRGIKDVSLELNGIEVQGEAAGTRDLKVMPVSDRKELDLTWNVSLKRGANMITVVARDSDNLVSRRSIEINYAEERGDVWAVVIGVSQYKHVEGLKFADNDARAFYNYLITDNAIPADHVILLTNEDATLQRVKDVLGVEIKQKARKQDTVIIYFAGHGAPEPDNDSPDGDGLEKYFLTYDTDPQRLYSTALPMQEVARIFGRIDSERIVLIQDTCYSGASGGRTIQTASIRASISDAYLNRITKGKGRVIISASSANEVSMEKDSLGHGVFTYYLLESLKHGDTDSDGFITTGEIYRYVSDKVPAATNRNQHPVKKGEEVEGEIIIGKARKE